MENRTETIVARPSQITDRFFFTEIPRSVRRRKRITEGEAEEQVKQYRYKVRGTRTTGAPHRQKSRVSEQYHSIPPIM